MSMPTTTILIIPTKPGDYSHMQHPVCPISLRQRHISPPACLAWMLLHVRVEKNPTVC